MEEWVPIGYLISAIFFIFGLKKLGHPRTAPRGNQFGMLGMATAIVTTIVDMNFARWNCWLDTNHCRNPNRFADWIHYGG